MIRCLFSAFKSKGFCVMIELVLMIVILSLPTNFIISIFSYCMSLIIFESLFLMVFISIALLFLR
nr:MAG TPA: hypothetical protein [Bacteriophage sp.]